MDSFETFADAYADILRDVLHSGELTPGIHDPTSIGSNFGHDERPTRELVGYSFEVRDPGACVVTSPLQSPRLAFCFGLFLWTLSGSDSESWIHYYNSRAIDFSDDGVRLSAAFGPRLFDNNGVNQIEAIFKRLSSDPYSRRTAASILLPSDNKKPTRDYPCAIGVEYLQRGGALHAITLMRSQSALRVLPYDAFVFMNLQRWLAARLGLSVGTYKHFAASMHVYEDETEFAAQVLEAGVTGASAGPFDDRADAIDRLLQFERDLRDAVTANQEDRVGALFAESNRLSAGIGSDPGFVQDCRAVLLAHAFKRLGRQADCEHALRTMNPSLRAIVSTS